MTTTEMQATFEDIDNQPVVSPVQDVLVEWGVYFHPTRVPSVEKLQQANEALGYVYELGDDRYEDGDGLPVTASVATSLAEKANPDAWRMAPEKRQDVFAASKAGKVSDLSPEQSQSFEQFQQDRAEIRGKKTFTAFKEWSRLRVKLADELEAIAEAEAVVETEPVVAEPAEVADIEKDMEQVTGIAPATFDNLSDAEARKLLFARPAEPTLDAPFQVAATPVVPTVGGKHRRHEADEPLTLAAATKVNTYVPKHAAAEPEPEHVAPVSYSLGKADALAKLLRDNKLASSIIEQDPKKTARQRLSRVAQKLGLVVQLAPEKIVEYFHDKDKGTRRARVAGVVGTIVTGLTVGYMSVKLGGSHVDIAAGSYAPAPPSGTKGYAMAEKLADLPVAPPAAPPAAPAAAEVLTPPTAPEIKFDPTAHSEWAAMQGAGFADDQIMGKLDEAAKASSAAGVPVEWVTQGADRWLELINADGVSTSDPAAVMQAIGKYISK